MRKVNGVYLADTARVLGEVVLAQDVNIWYGVSIRGDVALIQIGARSNVQDNAVIHCDHDYPNIIGCDVTIGHGAIVHGEYVGDGTLIGMAATLLGHTRIGKGCVIAAGAVVPPGMEVPDGMVVMGVPGKIVRPVNEQEKAFMTKNPPHYVKLAELHVQQRLDKRVIPWGEKAPQAAEPTPKA
ncbi:MAG: gamma carbonic anhydrase family protein [Phycisphaeraceae bacterium]|nr:gamma carbonic anhydrase family protein [Phycisphaeraceae bacterium]